MWDEQSTGKRVKILILPLHLLLFSLLSLSYCPPSPLLFFSLPPSLPLFYLPFPFLSLTLPYLVALTLLASLPSPFFSCQLSLHLSTSLTLPLLPSLPPSPRPSYSLSLSLPPSPRPSLSLSLSPSLLQPLSLPHLVLLTLPPISISSFHSNYQREYYTLVQQGNIRDALLAMGVDGAKDVSQANMIMNLRKVRTRKK